MKFVLLVAGDRHSIENFEAARSQHLNDEARQAAGVAYGVLRYENGRLHDDTGMLSRLSQDDTLELMMDVNPDYEFEMKMYDGSVTHASFSEGVNQEPPHSLRPDTLALFLAEFLYRGDSLISKIQLSASNSLPYACALSALLPQVSIVGFADEIVVNPNDGAFCYRVDDELKHMDNEHRTAFVCDAYGGAPMVIDQGDIGTSLSTGGLEQLINHIQASPWYEEGLALSQAQVGHLDRVDRNSTR